ncbi:MAG TPA: hypothetical protein PLV25_05215, partial [Opitutales bacterium]|nr:hypothetical protein [Opitutales bacterium]
MHKRSPFPLLSVGNLQLLKEALPFLNVAELKQILNQWQLPQSGKKAAWIECLVTFISTGAIPFPPRFPAPCKAPKGQKQPLHLNALILYGAYKNDAATRAFLKQAIGPHFHFTVFGHDWIRGRWLSGSPPTFGAFIEFWCAEYASRKTHSSALKEEWAYLNFI